jgi:hypothetical protein
MTNTEPTAPAPHLGVSSWSLNRTLGAPHFDLVRGQTTRGETALSLVDLPARLREFGLDHLELCHFHIPSRDPHSSRYLDELRGALEASNVVLWSVLIDDGDLTDPARGEDWLEWNKSWIGVAAQLGARHVRVIAGKQSPTPENLELSRRRLQVLADYADTYNVRVLTENWFDLLGGADEVLWLLGELKGSVGLNFDFNNWHAPHKYEHLPRIAHLAESAHSKCVFDAPRTPDEADYVRCFEMLQSVGFKGQHTLIYDGADDDEWAHLEIERGIAKRFL